MKYTEPLIVRLKRVRPEQDSDLPLPGYMTPHAAGMDIRAAIPETLELKPGAITLVPTGFAMALPLGFEAQIRPRSGLAVKYGVSVINSPGTIDSDYRGEVKIGLVNFSDQPYTIRRGDRIAQMVIQRVYQSIIQVVETLNETERDSGGFGSTGA